MRYQMGAFDPAVDGSRCSVGMDMIDKKLLSSERLLYSGPANPAFLDGLPASLDHGFEQFDQLARERLFEVVVELAHNVWRYGRNPAGRGRVSIAHDAHGLFAEAISSGTFEDVQHVKEMCQQLTKMSNDELTQREIGLSIENLGTDESGIGFLKIFQCAKIRDDGTRMVVVETEYVGDVYLMCVRVYV